jgi:hypothetical protein
VSAYIVDDVTMHRAVAALVSAGLPASEASALGRQLWAMNAAAVESRYPSDHEDLGTHVAWANASAWQWKPAVDTSEAGAYGWPGDAWGSLHEVHYQCAERGVVELPLFKALEAALAAHKRATTPPPAPMPAGAIALSDLIRQQPRKRQPRKQRGAGPVGPGDRLEF